jgi:hypothetical protein
LIQSRRTRRAAPSKYMFVESKPIDGTDSDSLPLPFDSILFSIDV